MKRKRRCSCSCSQYSSLHHAKILCGWWSDPPSHAPSGTSQSTSRSQRQDPGHSRSQGSGQDCWPDPVNGFQDPGEFQSGCLNQFQPTCNMELLWIADVQNTSKYCEVASLMAERTVISASVQKCVLSDLVHQPRDSHYYHDIGRGGPNLDAQLPPWWSRKVRKWACACERWRSAGPLWCERIVRGCDVSVPLTQAVLKFPKIDGCTAGFSIAHNPWSSMHKEKSVHPMKPVYIYIYDMCIYDMNKYDKIW